jgi:hypothetical protein
MALSVLFKKGVRIAALYGMINPAGRTGVHRRVKFRMNVSSEETWMNAASRGLIIPTAARTVPSASTITVP